MKNFSEWFLIIKDMLKKQNINLDKDDYDTIIVKQLMASNTLDAGRTTNQTHIAITGKQMDIFPFFISPSYYENQLKENKKHFITRVNITLNQNNISYLKENLDVVKDNILIDTYTNIVCSFRKDGTRQLQMSFLDMDEKSFIEFRKLLNTGDYLIILKASKDFKYMAFGIKEKDSLEISKYNNKITINHKTVTPININLISSDIIKYKNNPIQKIYFGPPGTGKSYNVSKNILKEQIKIGLIPNDSQRPNNDFVFRTTLYPDYSYYDFIGNIMPIVSNDGDITYDFKPGIFTIALTKALQVSDENIPVYLVIEEMSRGNVASIFGDIFQLLDRDENGVSEYEIDNDIIAKYLSIKNIEEYKIMKEDKPSKKEIYLPPNLNILGTINTSDQNVFVMDTAFKRRFDFEYVDIDPIFDEKKGEYLNEFSFRIGDYDLKWNDFYQKLNDYIITNLEMPEDKQIGQFFIRFDKKTPKENYRQLQGKLLQYLWEDVHSINITGYRLFDKKYNSFSRIYKAFGQQENVFDNNFMKIFDNELVNKLGNVAEDEEAYTTDEGV